MTHSPDGASAGGLDLDELEKQLRLAVRRATLVYSDGSPYGVQQAADDAWALVLRALSPSPGLGEEGIPGSPSAHASPLRSAAATEPGGLSEGAFTDNNIRRMAAMICEFMGWCEDGPAWDDAMKLARQVHEPAYQEGWNDREGDLIAGVNRVLPLSSEAPSPKSEPQVSAGKEARDALIPPGFVVAPREATKEMRMAVWRLDRDHIAALSSSDLSDIYRAMIAALPPPGGGKGADSTERAAAGPSACAATAPHSQSEGGDH